MVPYIYHTTFEGTKDNMWYLWVLDRKRKTISQKEIAFKNYFLGLGGQGIGCLGPGAPPPSFFLFNPKVVVDFPDFEVEIFLDIIHFPPL